MQSWKAFVIALFIAFVAVSELFRQEICIQREAFGLIKLFALYPSRSNNSLHSTQGG